MSFLLLFSCKKTPDEKAQSLIKGWLKLNLHDWKSYDPVEFGKLDSSYSSLDDDQAYQNTKRELDSLYKAIKEDIEDERIYAPLASYSGQYAYYKSLAAECYKRIIEDTAIVSNAIRKWEPTYLGRQMEHTFRSKNLGGNIGVHHIVFYFDSSLTRVIDDKDVGNKSSW